MQVMSGKEVSTAIYADLQTRTEAFVQTYGYAPTLAVVLVGNNPASQSYVLSKKKACLSLGFGHLDYSLSEETTQEELLQLVKDLNANPSVHGILVQLPLPAHMDSEAVIETIDQHKDVDGFHPMSIGKLLIGLPTFVSCTPLGVLTMLDHYKIETAGKNVVIVGRSNIVGRPLANLLSHKSIPGDCTVTICHSHTKNIKELTLQADIIVAAYDSKQTPEVFYKMGVDTLTEEQLAGATPLVGEEGIVKLKIPAGGIGEQRFAGLIKIKAPDGIWVV